mgnify:CR=1 FL=1
MSDLLALKKDIINQFGTPCAVVDLNILEKNIYSAIKNNIFATFNLCQLAIKNSCDMIFISTDKAAQVSGTYGATKYLMERMFTQFEQDYPQTKFRIVRYGLSLIHI